MLEKKRIIRFIQLLCLGTLAACQPGQIKTPKADSVTSTPAQMAASAKSEQANVNPTAGTATVKANSNSSSSSLPGPSSAYQEAINLASSAFTLGQQATSSDDWDLIVGRWEQAIQKLGDVPTADQNYSAAQTKIKDYKRNLAQAQQRLANLKQPPAEIALNRPPTPLSEQATTAATVSNRIPIVERRGGTPVVEVTFNGRRYPMILDTGASHTHITRAMANELGVQVVGQASVSTASNSRAVVDVGYVESIQVGSITRRNLPVSIGDAVPIGLLGNDVYENFDVILQANAVEFRPR